MGERYIREKKERYLTVGQKQLQSSLDEMINELPTSCDIGMKKMLKAIQCVGKDTSYMLL